MRNTGFSWEHPGHPQGHPPKKAPRISALIEEKLNQKEWVVGVAVRLRSKTAGVGLVSTMWAVGKYPRSCIRHLPSGLALLCSLASVQVSQDSRSVRVSVKQDQVVGKIGPAVSKSNSNH